MTEPPPEAGGSATRHPGDPGLRTALRLTLLDLLLAPVGAWNVRTAVLIVAAAGLLNGRVLTSALAWGALAALMALRVVADWPLSDNHAYLLAYWCLAICLALRTGRPATTLARSARLLIGLVFAFAALWKGVVSQDFVDGRFFRVTFLADDRFAAFAMKLGGISQSALERANELIESDWHTAATIAPSHLETPRLRALASAFTWASLGIEAGIALCFLLPDRIGVGRLRDLTLLAFCATTYAVAPVPGFGWLLIAMGTAQCPAERRGIRGLYLACFALVIAYDQLPFAG